ncbi:hypothetical protein AWT69_004489 [Pseudomonas putida]|nr:hypothetical protein AWT69_004489 [Pseudomonas putida]
MSLSAGVAIPAGVASEAWRSPGPGALLQRPPSLRQARPASRVGQRRARRPSQ